MLTLLLHSGGVASDQKQEWLQGLEAELRSHLGTRLTMAPSDLSTHAHASSCLMIHQLPSPRLSLHLPTLQHPLTDFRGSLAPALGFSMSLL